MKEVGTRSIKKVPALRGRTVVNLFFEPSTRTRTSFEIAEKRLSADTVSIAATGSSVSKGETLADTVRNLEAMAPDLIVLRHASAGAGHLAARLCGARVINAGDGMHEHPTQALLDAFTIRAHKGGFAGLRVAIVGDLLHSRVFRSNLLLLRALGAEVRACGPATLMLPDMARLGVRATTSVDEAVAGADVVMLLRVQLERMRGHFFPSRREYFQRFGMTPARLQRAAPDAIVMHPGPMNRGVEIAPEVADGSRSVILEQAANGVAVRMRCCTCWRRAAGGNRKPRPRGGRRPAVSGGSLSCRAVPPSGRGAERPGGVVGCQAEAAARPCVGGASRTGVGVSLWRYSAATIDVLGIEPVSEPTTMLKGGRVVDPAAGLDGVADVLIRDGRVARVGPDLEAEPGAVVIDVPAACVVCPGFIDMHAHLREPGAEHRETVATGVAAAVAGGFTAVACTPDTDPANDEAGVTGLILAKAAEAGLARVHPIGAVTEGRAGRQLAVIGELRDAGCVAVSDAGRPVADAMLMRRALEYAAMCGMPVIDHCEDAALTAGGVANEGATTALLGLRGMPAAAEAIVAERDVALSGLTGAPVHLAHVSTRGALRAVRSAKARGVPVTCEVTPHPPDPDRRALAGYDTHCKGEPAPARRRRRRRPARRPRRWDHRLRGHRPRAAPRRREARRVRPRPVRGRRPRDRGVGVPRPARARRARIAGPPRGAALRQSGPHPRGRGRRPDRGGAGRRHRARPRPAGHR